MAQRSATAPFWGDKEMFEILREEDVEVLAEAVLEVLEKLRLVKVRDAKARVGRHAQRIYLGRKRAAAFGTSDVLSSCLRGNLECHQQFGPGLARFLSDRRRVVEHSPSIGDGLGEVGLGYNLVVEAKWWRDQLQQITFPHMDMVIAELPNVQSVQGTQLLPMIE